MNVSVEPRCFASHDGLIIENLCKSYGDLLVLDHLNLNLEGGRTYCLMGPSGSGKTTLLRLILGLEQSDEGTIVRPKRLAAVFQEDRLCEAFSPLDNVMMAAGKLSRSQIRAELCRILPEEAILRPTSTLSGGMKRRVAIMRSLLAPSDGILMDEPFTGLDETTKHQVISYIKEKTTDKLLLIATHQEEDSQLLKADILRPF